MSRDTLDESLFTYMSIGETDWKVIAIDVNDPLASQLNGIPWDKFGF